MNTGYEVILSTEELRLIRQLLKQLYHHNVPAELSQTESRVILDLMLKLPIPHTSLSASQDYEPSITLVDPGS